MNWRYVLSWKPAWEILPVSEITVGGKTSANIYGATVDNLSAAFGGPPSYVSEDLSRIEFKIKFAGYDDPVSIINDIRTPTDWYIVTPEITDPFLIQKIDDILVSRQ